MSVDTEFSAVNPEDEEKMQDLKNALAGALAANGVLGKIRAQLRASAVSLLRSDPGLKEAAVGSTVEMKKLPLETQVAFLLIHEFLSHHKMDTTAGIFAEEGAISEVNVEIRELMRNKLGSDKGTSDKCILSSLVKDALDGVRHISADESGKASDGPHAGDESSSLRQSAPVAAPQEVEDVFDERDLKESDLADGEVNVNAEQLQLLSSIPAVARALSQLEESYEYRDVEGPLVDNQADPFDKIVEIN